MTKGIARIAYGFDLRIVSVTAEVRHVIFSIKTKQVRKCTNSAGMPRTHAVPGTTGPTQTLRGSALDFPTVNHDGCVS
jgi:hypothetical protein